MDTEQTLRAQVGEDPTRSTLVGECVELIDAEVRSKKGLSGVAIKGAYGTVKKIKPAFVKEVVDALLDDWLEKLEPHYSDFRAKDSGNFAGHVEGNADAVSEALLEVTDERAAKSKHGTVAKLYKRLRGKAKANVIVAVPKLGALLDGHLGAQG